MKHMSWGWTLLAILVVVVVLYAVWDFAWVHLIHSEAVDNASR